VASVLLLHVDGKIPNLALMRIARHHRNAGDDVELRYATTPARARPHLWDAHNIVYASAIFEKSAAIVQEIQGYWPHAVVGGTGVSNLTLEQHGINTTHPDYSIYPKWRQSIGFTQRGCRLKCSFCVVPKKEGSVREEATIADIWRGDPWPRELILLDNDFFGQSAWRERIAEIREGRFKVSFNQGINARFLTNETAESIASVDYRDDQMKAKRIYTAWDNRKDEARLAAGLDCLFRAGVRPDNVMVYMLVGYDHRARQATGRITDDDVYRVETLRRMGARPYPMPFLRTRDTVGFQRWVVRRAYHHIGWREFVAAGYCTRTAARATDA
jgi:hypothetical protein